METTNSIWLKKQDEVTESHSKLEMMLKIREDLLWRRRSETEGLAVYWNGFWKESVRIGITVRNSYELRQIDASSIVWPRTKQTNHKCHSEHCRIYNIPKGVQVPTHQPDKDEFIITTGEWYLCLNTGKLHRCPPGVRCNALKVTKDPMHGITLAYICVISNMVKSTPTSSRPEWDGATFYSRDTLRKLDDQRDDAEKSEVEDPDEDESEKGDASDEEDYPAKRQRADVSDDEDMPIKKQRTADLLPYSAVLMEFGSDLTFDELVNVVVEKRYLEEQRLLAKKRKDLENRKYSMAFATSLGNRKKQKWFDQLRDATSLWKEKEKGRGNQPKRRSERRESIIRTAEQKTERCLAKANEKMLYELIEAITAASVMDNIVRCKLFEAVGAADQAVYSLKRKYSDVPLSIQIGTWCQSVNASVGLPLKTTGERKFNAKECVSIVMCHWKLASFSPYVTEALDIHKKKKRKPLDFLLFSLGILYLMAHGGETVNLRWSTPVPETLRKKFPKIIARIERDVTVKELPDKHESWGKWTLAPEMLPYLQRVYRDDWIFNCRTVADGKQLVKTCNISRYRQAESQLAIQMKTLEANTSLHTDAELGRQLEQYYKQYLRELIPAHSSSREWQTLTSSTTNGQTIPTKRSSGM